MAIYKRKYISNEDEESKLEYFKNRARTLEKKLEEQRAKREQQENILIKKNVKLIDIQDFWLFLDKNLLKVLIAIVILKGDNDVFCGKVEDISQLCDIKTHSTITKAFSQLKAEGAIVKYKRNNKGKSNPATTYTIQIAPPENKRQITRIPIEWLYNIINYNKDDNLKVIDTNKSVEWSNILKVFVYSYKKGYYIKSHNDLAVELNIKTQEYIDKKNNEPNRKQSYRTGTISRVFSAIKELNINMLTFEIKAYSIKNKIGEYKTIGTKVIVEYDFTKYNA